jgi:hypothetical protein
MVKKKGFKQLAGYSIKCLQALMVSSRIGWEIQARAAFELGGTRAVLDVLVKYPTDAELLRFGLAACRSMVSVPGLSGTSVDSVTTSLSISLLKTLVTDTTMAEADRATLTAEALEYNLALARRSTTSQPDAGLLDIVGTIADRLAAPPKASVAASSASAATDANARALLSGTVFRLLVALVATREGLQSLATNHGLLERLLAAARCVYDLCSATVGAPKGSKAAAGAAAPAGAAKSTVEVRVLKLALDPLVRVLDRLSRVPEGDAALAAVKAGATLMPLADWWVHAQDAEAAAPAASASASSKGAAATATSSATVVSPVAMLDLVNRLAGEGIQVRSSR